MYRALDTVFTVVTMLLVAQVLTDTVTLAFFAGHLQLQVLANADALAFFALIALPPGTIHNDSPILV